MKEICIYCTTPFQIMTAIHLCLIKDNETEMDLYIVNKFQNSESVVCSLRELNVFRRVTLIHEDAIINNEDKSKIALWPQMALSYLKLDKSVRTLLKENLYIHYDSMYISSKSYPSRLVAMYYIKHSIDIEFVYYDDGLGSYFDKSVYYPRLSDRMLRKILLGRKASLLNPKKVLLYDPELFKSVGVNASNEIFVEAIPKWREDELFKKFLNTVFSYSEEDNIEEQIIIFDGLYSNKQKKLFEKFYKEIIKIAGDKNVIIKKHPRDTGQNNKDLRYYKKKELPFELICLNSKGMKNKMLISLTSTAVITPKLLLGEEPFVMTLNKIPEFSRYSFNVDFSFLKNTYEKNNKFIEPNSFEEALAYIKCYCNTYISN